ncbi:hypothetical protein PG994_004356 [Apiospora phragmitis]|uniref:Uncharacterized protein n=1 Tax=Apiospora phragmitis TaxID=2905665 RepID=A0ABR1VQH0_9PEZI
MYVIEQALENQPKLTQEIKEKYWINNDPLPRRGYCATYLSDFTRGYRQGYYRSRTWGYTIIRTVYGDEWDAKFQDALATLRRTVEAIYEDDIARRTAGIQQYVEWGRWPEDFAQTADRRIEDEFYKRFVNEVLEDRDVLSDASVDQIRAYFLPWAQERFAIFHPRAAARGGRFRDCDPGSPRLFACMLLDAETVEQLQGAPESPAELYPRLRDFWVKMVEAQPQPRVDFGDASMVDWYRVRLADLVTFWWDCSELNPQRTTDEPDPQDVSIRYYNAGGWTPPEFRLKARLRRREEELAKFAIANPASGPEPAPSKADTSQFWRSVLD